MALECFDRKASEWYALEPSFMSYLISKHTNEPLRFPDLFDLKKIRLKDLARNFAKDWKIAYDKYEIEDKEYRAKRESEPGESREYPEYPYVFCSGPRNYELFALLSGVRGEMPLKIGQLLTANEEPAIHSEPINSELSLNRDYHSFGYATLEHMTNWSGWNKRFPEFNVQLPYNVFIKNGKWIKGVKMIKGVGRGPRQDPYKCCSPLLFELAAIHQPKSIGSGLVSTYPPVNFRISVIDPKLSDELAFMWKEERYTPVNAPCEIKPALWTIAPQWFMGILKDLRLACRSSRLKYDELRLVCCYDN